MRSLWVPTIEKPAARRLARSFPHTPFSQNCLQDQGRDPTTSFSVLWVAENPNAHGTRPRFSPSGPSPLGRFNGRSTTRVGLSLRAKL